MSEANLETIYSSFNELTRIVDVAVRAGSEVHTFKRGRGRPSPKSKCQVCGETMSSPNHKKEAIQSTIAMVRMTVAGAVDQLRSCPCKTCVARNPQRSESSALLERGRRAWTNKHRLVPFEQCIFEDIRRRVAAAGQFSTERQKEMYKRLLSKIEVDNHIPVEYPASLLSQGDPGSHIKIHNCAKYAEDFILAKTAMARLPESADAFARIQEDLSKTIEVIISHPYVRREKDDARQQAQLGLLRACETYDPTKGAAFKTYASMWIKRKVEARRSSDCKQGMAIVHGKPVKVAQINPLVEGEDSARNYREPVAPSDEDQSVSWDVREAMNRLASVLVGDTKLDEFADEFGIPSNRARQHVKALKAALADTLSDYQVT